VTAATDVSPPPQPARQSIRFRARSFIAFALAPELPIVDWLTELDAWTKTSPGFFVGRPVILDLAATSLSASGLAHLVSELAERGVRIMGLENADPDQLGTSLPPLLKGGRPAASESAGEAPSPAAAAAIEPVREEPTSLVLDKPVRSGQSIVFPHGDVIVVGSVGSGAEVVAGGSIHIHGALRGRAMAGATGKPGARIFCRKNEAELLAIDGYYQTAEEMNPKLRGQAVQAFFEDGLLQVTALD
jgi:septum site-determining protein MinC